MHIILCGGILLYRLKRKIKFIVVFLIIIICCNCVQNSYARTYKGDAINVDDKLREVKYEHLTENASYGKYYWTAWNKGTYDFAKVETFYAALDYYDKSNDILKVLLISVVDVSHFGDDPKDGSEPANHIRMDSQYYLRNVIQGMHISGSLSNKFEYGSYTPEHENGTYTITKGLGVSLETSNNSDSFKIEYSNSISETNNNFELKIQKTHDNGRDWKYNCDRNCNEAKSEFTSIVSKTLYLKNASNYNNLQFDAHFSYYAKWHLPVCGWEQYDPYIGDQHNQSIDKLIQFKINI